MTVEVVPSRRNYEYIWQLLALIILEFFVDCKKGEGQHALISRIINYPWLALVLCTYSKTTLLQLSDLKILGLFAHKNGRGNSIILWHMWDYNKSINLPLHCSYRFMLPSSFKSFVSKRMERKVCEQTLSASTARRTLTATFCYIWQFRFQIRFSHSWNFNGIRIIRLCLILVSSLKRF